MYSINSHNLVLTDSYYQSSYSCFWAVNDGEENKRAKGIRDHVEAGDYFASLATVLDLTGQKVERVDKSSSRRLRYIKKDLLHLQKNYYIVEK